MVIIYALALLACFSVETSNLTNDDDALLADHGGQSQRRLARCAGHIKEVQVCAQTQVRTNDSVLKTPEILAWTSRHFVCTG